MTAYKAVGQKNERQLQAKFDESFQPHDEPLPLDELPGLNSLMINENRDLSEEQLNARLKAIRKLRPETQLVVLFESDQGAAFDLLGEIPHLQRLLFPIPPPPLAPADSKTSRTLSLGSLTELRMLQLVDVLTDEHLAELGPLVNLEQLILWQQGLPVSLGLTCLDNKPKLVWFATGNVQPTDAALARIGRLTKLEKLQTNIAAVTDVGVTHLAKLTNLKMLVLEGEPGPNQDSNRVTADGLQAIGKLTNLNTLFLFGKILGAVESQEMPHVTDQLLAGWSPQLKNLKELQIADCDLTDEGMILLSKLPSLTLLGLFGQVQISQRGREALGTMTTLRELTLTDPGMTDDDLKLLGQLTNLEALSLSQAEELTDDALAALAALKRLDRLSVSSSKITGRGMAALKGLGHLQTLNLYGDPINDAGVETITTLATLRELNLAQTKITDAALKSIGSRLKELTTLDISGTQVTDGGLDALVALKHLREVQASGTAITDAGRKKLAGVVLMIGPNMWTGRFEVYEEVDD